MRYKKPLQINGMLWLNGRNSDISRLNLNFSVGKYISREISFSLKKSKDREGIKMQIESL